MGFLDRFKKKSVGPAKEGEPSQASNTPTSWEDEVRRTESRFPIGNLREVKDRVSRVNRLSDKTREIFYFRQFVPEDVNDCLRTQKDLVEATPQSVLDGTNPQFKLYHLRYDWEESDGHKLGITKLLSLILCSQSEKDACFIVDTESQNGWGFFEEKFKAVK